jgi:hypothetical protein
MTATSLWIAVTNLHGEVYSCADITGCEAIQAQKIGLWALKGPPRIAVCSAYPPFYVGTSWSNAAVGKLDRKIKLTEHKKVLKE